MFSDAVWERHVDQTSLILVGEKVALTDNRSNFSRKPSRFHKLVINQLVSIRPYSQVTPEGAVQRQDHKND